MRVLERLQRMKFRPTRMKAYGVYLPGAGRPVAYGDVDSFGGETSYSEDFVEFVDATWADRILAGLEGELPGPRPSAVGDQVLS